MSDLVHETLQVHRTDGIIVAVGELDLVGGPVLEHAVHAVEDADEPVAIDLSQVTFVDSSGLRCLIAASQRSAARGRRVRVISPTNVVSRLLEITATASMFDIE